MFPERNGEQLRLDVMTTPSKSYGNGLTSSPVTSTLVIGPSSAVLIDAQASISDAKRVAETVRRSGKRLTHIYITHGHFDHCVGASVIKQEFRGVKVVAVPGVVEYLSARAGEQITRAKARFGDDVPDVLEIPEPLLEEAIGLDGYELRIVQVGQGDIAPSTVVHIPSLNAVNSGDVAYNGIHMWLGETTRAEREAWTKSLDAIEALQPKTIVTGHKRPGASDDRATAILDESRHYLDAFDRALAASNNADEVAAAMMARFPEFGNPVVLRLSAEAAFRSNRV